MNKRKILVTSALPYANGSIHLGHLVEYIQTDIWVRFQKMCLPKEDGHEIYFVCADDTHGTPIMLRAEKEGITPEALIERVHNEHLRDFTGFHIEFDNYYTTHSPETRQYSEDIYTKLKTKDPSLITTHSVEQFYDPVKNIFLPDRFIKGECPKCSAKDQYGDNCEICGAAYAPTDLRNPYSAVSSAALVKKTSEHFFFKLSDNRCVSFLRKWTLEENHLQTEAANKMREWLGEKEENKLIDWDISRDAPYFGFEIPDAPGKYFYVWLDAPIGYMGSFKNLCNQRNINFDEFWNKNSATELYHFIGKDILYFHALFWPAMLENSGYRTPTQIFCHGFLTINGEKMSKSRGTFITAENYLKQGLNPEWLRYYYAAKLNGTMEDIDLSFDDFITRVNSDLVGKYVNIASRSASFLVKYFHSQIADISGQTCKSFLQEPGPIRDGKTRLVHELLENAAIIRTHMENRRYNLAISEIMALTGKVNEYWDQQKPWDKAKQIDEIQLELALHLVSSITIECFRILTIFLKPILPMLAQKAESFLNVEPMQWEDLWKTLPQGHKIKSYEHLMVRIDRKKIDAMIKASK
ncbi:MAG: methionine--tRNA ligase [Betaproteobacteria bacterium]|nr:MAG: methionine--tRNA ligase [Betaproteobacteria bacterium]